MDLAGADPAAGMKKISDELQEKFQEAGMGAVDTFVDTLDEVKDMVQKGPGKALEAMKGQFDKLQEKLDEIMADPGSLAPPGIAACASWYGNAVAGKLKSLKGDAQEILDAIVKLVSDLTEPMKKLGETLDKAMSQLDGTVKKLAKLPSEISKLSGEVKGAEDVAKIDTKPMKDCLKVDGISGPLTSLSGLKGPLESAIGAVVSGVESILDFIGSLPGKIKGAFDIPQPLCFLQGALMSQAPPPMKALLDQTDAMKNLDLEPMKKSLGKVKDSICNLDPETVTKPVNAFAEKAGDSVGNLDKLVSGAKMASGGGALGGLKKMF